MDEVAAANTLNIDFPDAALRADFSLDSGGIQWDVNTASALLVMGALAVIVLVRLGMG